MQRRSAAVDVNLMLPALYSTPTRARGGQIPAAALHTSVPQYSFMPASPTVPRVSGTCKRSRVAHAPLAWLLAAGWPDATTRHMVLAACRGARRTVTRDDCRTTSDKLLQAAVCRCQACCHHAAPLIAGNEVPRPILHGLHQPCLSIHTLHDHHRHAQPLSAKIRCS
jgi:hypothetical protein